MQLIQYRRSDGQIERIWSSNSRALLAGHVLTEDAGDVDYLWRDDEPMAAVDLVTRWRVEAGELRAHESDTLRAEPSTTAVDAEG